MLRALSNVVSPMLVMLLVVLTPVGTGQGAHRDQLLDPLFPHIHLAGGLTSRQSAAMTAAERALKSVAAQVRRPDGVAPKNIDIDADRQGPAFGAGAGAAATALSPGLMPPVPSWLAPAPTGSLDWAVVELDALPPGALAEPPPDPPPTAA